MRKRYIFVAGSMAAVILVVGVAYVLANSHADNKATPTTNPTDSNQTSDTGLSGDQTSINSDSSNGLNIVQTNPNNPQSSAQTAPPASGQQPAQIDPSKFGDYEKYKNGQTALYADIQVGTGETIQTGQTAAVYYKGWLTNGQLFDQTRTDASGKLSPYVFGFGAHQVIAGWEQAMAGMKVGGTRLLIVPPAVGYGAKGQGPIPGNSVLVFEVQLLAVQ